MESFLSRKKSCFAVKYHRSQYFPPHISSKIHVEPQHKYIADSQPVAHLGKFLRFRPISIRTTQEEIYSKIHLIYLVFLLIVTGCEWDRYSDTA